MASERVFVCNDDRCGASDHFTKHGIRYHRLAHSDNDDASERVPTVDFETALHAYRYHMHAVNVRPMNRDCGEGCKAFDDVLKAAAREREEAYQRGYEFGRQQMAREAAALAENTADLERGCLDVPDAIRASADARIMVRETGGHVIGMADDPRQVDDDS